MTGLSAYIEGIGLLGPGLEGWAPSVGLLTGVAPYSPQPTILPVPEVLPAAERRRVVRVVKLALAVGFQAVARAGADPATLPSVFSSSGGDGHNCHEICESLASDERQLSPTRFHNSVHNAAAGYWSIATGAKVPSNVLCAYDFGFGAGLLEAVTQVVVDQTAVLLLVYDSQYPAPLFMKRPIPDAFGIAFVLARQQRDAAIAKITLSFADSSPDRMTDPRLEVLRTSIPAARGLPLLRQLAAREHGKVILEYLDGRGLAVEIDPCS
jgi:hypothetical protein